MAAMASKYSSLRLSILDDRWAGERRTRQMLLCRVPVPKAFLLFGASGSGKSMLAHAIAHEAGALFFDISPRLTDGKYIGKAVSMMLHMVRMIHLCRHWNTPESLL